MKTNYTALWLILAISLAIITLISFADQDLTLGQFTLKKAPIADMLTYDKQALKEDSIKVQQELDSLRSAKEEVSVDTLPQSILIFGDSMTYNLALRLAQYAKANGHTIHAINWDSSSTYTWGTTDTLTYYIKKYQPTQIFVSLGSNELYLKNLDARIPDIKRILEMIDTIPYVWIGPPNWKEDAGINDAIEKLCKPGCFFRSAGMDFKRKKDHIHPTRESSAYWIDSIMRWLPNSAHPFVVDVPSDSIGKVNPNIVFLKALNK